MKEDLYIPYTEKEQQAFKRILIINTAFIGDVILTSPLIRACTKYFSNAEVDLLLIPETRNVFGKHPAINKIHIFDKRKFSNRVSSFLRVTKNISDVQYDLAISLQSSFTSSLIMVLAGIKNRVGFHRQKLVTKTIEHIRGLHMRIRMLRLMEVFTDEKYPDQTELFWGEETNIKVQDLLKQSLNYSFITIAPGSAKFTKQWVEEHYIKLLDKLYEHEIYIYLIGGDTDKELCERIKGSTTNKNVFNLAGKLSILESAALIKQSELLLSGDSAPMHLANAVETKVLAIFGPTVKALGFYPYREEDEILEIELDCRPCGKHGGSKCPLAHFRCMMDVKPELVLSRILDSVGAK